MEQLDFEDQTLEVIARMLGGFQPTPHCWINQIDSNGRTGYICTLTKGHDGPHLAHTSPTTICYAWVNDDAT